MPRHPSDYVSGPSGAYEDSEESERRDRDESLTAAQEVLGFLSKEMRRAERQGAAPDNVVEQMPSIIAALLDQIVRNVQPRDDAGRVIPIVQSPSDVDRLARALKTLNDVQQSWIKLGIEAARAAGMIIVQGDVDDDGPRRIAYPIVPPVESEPSGDGPTDTE